MTAQNCRMPVISLIAWEDRAQGFVFVKIPNERGRYLRTDLSVVNVPCAQCNATIGEPCKRVTPSGLLYTGGTHTARRYAMGSRFPAGARDHPEKIHKDIIEKPRVRLR